MIRLPTRARRDGEDESFPSAASTWRVEWDRRDENGRELPQQVYLARLVTPYGNITRQIRLLIASESTGA